MKLFSWRLLPLLMFSLLILFFWRGLSLEPAKLPSVQLGKSLPQFELPLLNSKGSLAPKTMAGKVVLLNVWASWCSACLEEQVFLLRLAREGIAIYGLNYKDNPEEAMQWLRDWGNPYRLVAEDKKGQVAIDLGVYGAPETFLIDKQGIIRFRYAGPLNEKIWSREFLPHIKRLKEG